MQKWKCKALTSSPASQLISFNGQKNRSWYISRAHHFQYAQCFMNKLPNCYYTDPFLRFKGSKYFLIHKHITSCHAVAMGTIRITTSLSNFVGHHEVHQIIHLMWTPIIPHLATGVQLKISNGRNIIPPLLWGKKKTPVTWIMVQLWQPSFLRVSFHWLFCWSELHRVYCDSGVTQRRVLDGWRAEEITESILTSGELLLVQRVVNMINKRVKEGRCSIFFE
jgi:hypothetical protein